MPSSKYSYVIDLTQEIKKTGLALGFDDVKVTDTNTKAYHPYYRQAIARGFAAKMDYLVRHGDKRLCPEKLLPGTKSIIIVRQNYLPPELVRDKLQHERKLYRQSGLIARYALGRDYHKVLKSRLKTFASSIVTMAREKILNFKACVDSAPLLEKPLAEKAGLGWQGRNGLIVSDSGSWFFIGSLLTNLELEYDKPISNKCSTCQACQRICPTGAIVADRQIETKRCIAYLTIEHKGSIDIELRSLMGNRIFGCDDCQLICPYNRWSQATLEKDFFARRGLETPSLVDLAYLTEDRFKTIFSGSPLMRAGYDNLLRNVAIALGNSEGQYEQRKAVHHLCQSSNALILEHALWARERLQKVPLKIRSVL